MDLIDVTFIILIGLCNVLWVSTVKQKFVSWNYELIYEFDLKYLHCSSFCNC